MVDDRNPVPRLVGGHAVLDLVNTVAPRLPDGGEATEFLTEPADLRGWALRAGVVDAAEADAVGRHWAADPEAGRSSLRAAVEIREAVYAVLAARLRLIGRAATDDRAAVDAALDRLSLHWVRASARSALVYDAVGDAPARLVVGTVPGQLISDRLAQAAVDLLRSVRPDTLGVCPLDRGGCGWLFVDHSRNRSRRWCAMEDCGTHAKTRRLTARRRAAHSSTTK